MKAAGNIELCEPLDVQPKAQCKVCLSYWDVGIVYCTCGHILRDDTKENKRYLKFTLILFSIPNYYIKKGRPHGHRYGKKPGITSTSSRIRSRRNATRDFSWVFTTGSSVMRSSARIWLNWVAVKKYVVRWTNWRTRITPHHITPDEIRVYRNNWWIRSNFNGSDTMPVRHRADFKEALSTLGSLKNQEDQAYYQNWWQSSSSSWWQWQSSWWHPSSEYHRDDGPRTDRSGKPAKQWLDQLFVEWFSTLIWCRITVTFGNSQQQFTVTDGGCKEYTSKYRKFHAIWLRRKRQQQHEQWDQAWDQLQPPQSEMTWTRTITCSPQSTTSTPMTTFT